MVHIKHIKVLSCAQFRCYSAVAGIDDRSGALPVVFCVPVFDAGTQAGHSIPADEKVKLCPSWVGRAIASVSANV